MAADRRLVILHASITGTALDLAHRISLQAHRLGFNPSVSSIARFPPAALITNDDPIVFILPTTGNGTAPPSFVPLWTALLHPDLPPDFLEHVQYATFGLGDSSYPKYNWVAKKFANRVSALGAHEILPLAYGDDQNEFGVESTFPQWSDELFAQLERLYPCPQGFVPLSAQALPPPTIATSPPIAGLDVASSDLSEQSLGWTDDCVWATLTKNDRVTRSDWWQDVRELELQVQEPSFSYSAGDVLELRPHNDPVQVQKFIEALGWESEADVVRVWTGRDAAHPLPPHLPSRYSTTLRHILTTELDISSVPKVGVFEWLSCFAAAAQARIDPNTLAQDDNEIGERDMADKLKEFASPRGQDDLMDYAIRPRRTLTEILHEFKKVVHGKIPFEYCFDWIPSMRPRGFSISSSPAAHDGNKVQLLVAIVKYKTNLQIQRRGVATSWIENLAPGARLPIRLDRTGQLRIPREPDAPLVMVGPGTGVAPFRALIEERTRRGIKDNLLFFGCRSLEADAHYHSYFSKLEREGMLQYSIAASRDQEDKVYVQHKILEHQETVSEWLSDQRGGYLYICGSSTAMPRAVKKSILAIFRTQGQLTEEAAEQRWDVLERQGRIREEVWG
ncbi:NAPDH-dependent diflavin reductase [Sporobolomyces koalae]|uniref:NAPDH-dependent diflavin reductase n=1 Tax=Sporobolomyces koalae TaxID=500713 RepID=UPI00316EFF06